MRIKRCSCTISLNERTISVARENEKSITSIKWLTKGAKGGHLPPGAALWESQIEVGILGTNYEMLNVRGC